MFRMTQRVWVAMLVLGFGMVIGCKQPDQMDDAAAHDLKGDMRKLWEEHVIWTRLYIVAAAANLPEKDPTAQRLLKNQEEIGAAIAPFYGKGIGDTLTALLKIHISIATEIIDAAMKGDNPGKEAAATRWGQNADSLASLLSGANPNNWPLADLKAMLHAHLDLTTQEVVAELGKDWTGSITAFDKIQSQALTMADALSAGLSTQMPAQPKKP